MADLVRARLQPLLYGARRGAGQIVGPQDLRRGGVCPSH